MRLFVGIYLKVEVLEEVSRFIQLVGNQPNLKWTSPQNLHFTLKFLGEVAAPRLTDSKQALSQAVAQNDSFQLQLGKVGCFPAKGSPRILWIGVTVGEKQLIKLASNIETTCYGYGFPREERPFSPHLTIARYTESISNFKLETDFDFSSIMSIGGFALIQSQLYPTGPVYQTIENFIFQK